MNGPDFNTSGYRYYSQPFNTNHGSQSFTLLFDPNLVWNNGQRLETGGWRPVNPSDLAANVSVSGLSVAVNAVSITGNPFVQILNPVTISGGNITAIDSQSRALLSGISGQLASNLTDPVSVTGSIIINSGTYLPTINIITGSQLQIPIGAKSASVTIISGYAYVQGNGPLLVGTSLNFGGYDGRFTLGSNIVVGATGNSNAPCNVLVVWEI